METYKLNPELHQMVRDNKLSDSKIEDLYFLKETVDRLSSKKFASDETVEELLLKFGETPNVITWGDYFQVEVASAHFFREDFEFNTICQTIYFDLISSILIFTNKKDSFFEHIYQNSLVVNQINREEWTLEDEEKAHLQILANYFKELGLKESALNEKDYDWFHGFAVAQAV